MLPPAYQSCPHLVISLVLGEYNEDDIVAKNEVRQKGVKYILAKNEVRQKW